MASATLAYSRGSNEDVWKVATELQQARHLRRMSQPAPLQNYRRDSITREPFQSYKRDSIARDSISNYRRDSITRDSLQDYRRTSITTDPFQSYRRDSITRDPIANYRRDSLTRDSIIREPTPNGNATANGTTGRRGSDADDINWIAKYKKSDHHTDRMISQKLDDAKAMTASISDDRSSQLRNRSSSFSSALSSSQSKPVHYEGTNRLTVFLQPAQASTPRSYATSHLPPVSLTSSRNDYRSPVTSDRYSRPSSVTGSSLSSVSSAFRRRSSVDSSLLRSSRSSAFTPFIPTSSTHSDFRASPSISSQSQPYRPSFTRAPSLPPSLQSRPPSTLPLPHTSLTTNGYSRSSAEGLTSSSLTSRRYSLANISDLSKPNYRRSVDLSALKSTSGAYKSSNLSTFGSGLLRRGSYETTSTLSPHSPLSPLSPSYLPPPSERIFGSRGTHTPLRRNRRSVADG